MTPPRVALVGLAAAGRSGVPRYAASMLGALDRTGGEFPLRLELLTTAHGIDAVRPENLDVRVVGGAFGRPRGGARRIVAEQLAARSARADIVHFFDLSGPVLAPRRRFVTTVHDAANAHGRRKFLYAYKRKLHPWALRHAAAIVAVSAFARDEAIAHLAAEPARVTVIHSGPGLEIARGNADAVPDGSFVLYVGDLSAHKNLPFLLDVFEAAALPVRLVLVGRRGESYRALSDRIRSSTALGGVTVLENADDATVDALYRHALATVLPSRYEGFGFTPLEAMARDCAVLASDIPALREVAGDGALLLPLDEAGPWVDALRRVVVDDGFRTSLRARGRQAVGRFSWDEAARALCRLFVRVAG